MLKENTNETLTVKELLTRTAYLILAVLALVLLLLPVRAEGADASRIQIPVTIVLPDSTVPVPNSTISFTVKAGTADSSASPVRYAGDTKKLKVGSVSFNASKNNTKNDVSKLGTNAALLVSPENLITEAQKSTAKYVTANAIASFTVDETMKPGIYCYEITPKVSGDTLVNGAASIKAQKLHVYIEQDENGKSYFGGAFLFDTKTVDGKTVDEKSGGFYYARKVNSLVIRKSVYGNNAEKSKQFAFTITLTGNKNDEVMVQKNTDSSPTALAFTSTTASIKTTLADGEYFTVYGMDDKMTYTIAETDSAGYKVMALYNGDKAYTEIKSKDNADTAKASLAKKTFGSADETVVVTNVKNGTVPTGIKADYSGYILMGALGISFLAVLVLRRTKRELK